MKKINGGLQLKKPDPRTFSYSKVFGAIDLRTIPENFIIAEIIKIEDQKSSDFCTSFAASTVLEKTEGVDLDPLYPFAKGKQLKGEIETWGLDMGTILKVMTKFGCIEKKDSPFTIDDERNKIANWENWNPELDKSAALHKQRSYFRIA